MGAGLRLRDGANNWQTGKFVHYNKALKKYRVKFQNEDFEYYVKDMKDLDATFFGNYSQLFVDLTLRFSQLKILVIQFIIAFVLIQELCIFVFVLLTAKKVMSTQLAH